MTSELPATAPAPSIDRTGPVSEPQFSIFIPVYNDARWLPGAIESVLGQTYPHWELIVADNASEDDLEALVRPYLADERVRYHRWARHANYADNYNRTILLCRFEWLQILSADDRLHPSALARMAERVVAITNDSGRPAMVLTACRPIDEAGQAADWAFSRSWRIKRVPDGLYSPEEWLRIGAAPGQVPWNMGSLAIAREVFETLGGFFRGEIGLAADLDMCLRASAYGTVAYIDEPLLDYTVRGDAIHGPLSHKDLAANGRTTTIGAALLSALGVHAFHREVSPAEQAFVYRMVAHSHIGRALQHRYLPGGHGRRGAIRDVVRAFTWSPGWFLSVSMLVRAVAAIVAPRALIVRAKDRFRRRRQFL